MAMGPLGACICVHLRVLGTALGPFTHRALKVNLINLLTFKDWYWLTNLIFSKPKDFCTPKELCQTRFLFSYILS